MIGTKVGFFGVNIMIHAHLAWIFSFG
jgi:hypothetical protein